MNRYLMLGTAQLDVTWLKMTPKGNVTLRSIVPVRLYEPMPEGYIGPAKDIQINAQFAPLELHVPAGQWLTIVPQIKLPPTGAHILIES
jgi:hypothetical protein